MASELIRVNGEMLGFGDYSLRVKTKLSDFPFQGDFYKVKTFKDITKLEKNELFVYESVPGTSVENFISDSKKTSFDVKGYANTQITLELEEDKEYTVKCDGENLGIVSTMIGGKLVVSVDLTGEKSVRIEVEKC